MAAPSRTKLRRVVDDLVVVQGNDFVKELLRNKGLRIGATKADFEASLHEAIESERLTAEDVETWLTEVEGWGAHHAYLFRFDSVRLRNLLHDTAEFRTRVRDARLVTAYDKAQPFAFPRVLTATGVMVSDGGLEIVWHQGTESWQRDKTRDYEEDREGDRYRFDAYRRRADRSVVRLVARPDNALGGMFISIPLGPDHDRAHEVASRAADVVLAGTRLTFVNVGQAQLHLDRPRPPDNRSVTTSRSRIRGQGAYVEFGSTIADGDFNDVDAVRNVRLAARDDLNGESGDFTFAIEGASTPRANVRVNLNAAQRRIYIRAQLNATQEWSILQQIADA